MPSGPSDSATSPAAARIADLAHPATDQLAGAARPADDLARADEHRADRAAEALGQAERDGVGRVGQVARRDAGRALGHDRVPEPGAVDVERDAVAPGDRRDLARVGRGQRLAHRVGVRVLDRDEAGDRLVGVGRVAEGALDRGGVERAVRAVLEAPRRSRRR